MKNGLEGSQCDNIQAITLMIDADKIKLTRSLCFMRNTCSLDVHLDPLFLLLLLLIQWWSKGDFEERTTNSSSCNRFFRLRQ